MKNFPTRLSVGVSSVLLTCVLSQRLLAQQPPPPEAPREPATLLPPPPTATDLPPHWHQRQGEPLAVTEPPPPVLPPWLSLGDLYIRADAGTHKETGFPERNGFGIELNGRLALPDAPWISLLGTIRNTFMDGSDRLSWTVGAMGDWGPIQAGGGIDGIYDNLTDTHVGTGFLFLSYQLPVHRCRVGVWSTFELWDDVHQIVTPIFPGLAQVFTFGVEPYEQTSVFIAGSLGPEGRWGEVYFAPGIETTNGRFRFSVGYQGTIVDRLDAFVHYQQTADGDRDWSIFAGLQLHFGCGSNRPWDFTMPQMIRARQKYFSQVEYISF